MNKRNPFSVLTNSKFLWDAMIWIILFNVSSLFTAHPSYEYFPGSLANESSLAFSQSEGNLHFYFHFEQSGTVIFENETEQNHQDDHRATAGNISRKATTTEPIRNVHASKQETPFATTVPRYLLFHCIKSDIA